LRLVVVLQGAQEIGVGAVLRGIGGVAKVEWLGAIGGAIQLIKLSEAVASPAGLQNRT
jgi:hypothetical protein